MDKFIIVFLSMLVTLTLATYLTSDKTTNESDIVLNFKDEKIKCNCNIERKNGKKLDKYKIKVII